MTLQTMNPFCKELLYMLSTLLRVMLPGNAKSIVGWDRVNANAHTRINLTKDRFINAPVFYSGMHQIFRHLILNMDLEYLIEVSKNPMAYYLSDLVPKAGVAKKLFDTVSVSTENYGMLMDRSNSPVIPEIWVATSRKNPLVELPLDTNEWNNGWDKVKCAIVFNYDTPYLNVEFLKGTLQFPSDIAPTYGLVGIDIPCVWLKFASWWTNIGTNKYQTTLIEPAFVDDFIHSCIMPEFYNDFFRIFTLNCLKLVIQGEFSEWKDAVDSLKTDWKVAMSGFDVGCVDVITNLDLVKRRGISVEDFISTNWLMTGDKQSYSIRNLMIEYTTQWSIPDLRQYHWVAMLRDLDMVLIVSTLLKLSPSYPIGERTKKELLYKINTYERAVPWGHMHSPSLRAKLSNSFNHIKVALER